MLDADAYLRYAFCSALTLCDFEIADKKLIVCGQSAVIILRFCILRRYLYYRSSVSLPTYAPTEASTFEAVACQSLLFLRVALGASVLFAYPLLLFRVPY